MDLKNFKLNLTPKQQQMLVAAVIGLAGFGYVYWNFLFSPNVKAISEKKAVLAKKKDELAKARDMVMKYPEFLRNAGIITKKVEFINKRLPSTMTISDTILGLSEKAVETNVRISKFTPDRETAKGDYTEYKIKMIMQADFANLGRFTTAMGYIEKLTVPDEIRIELNTDRPWQADALKVDMVAKVYKMNEQK